jgi:hypothetical protein
MAPRNAVLGSVWAAAFLLSVCAQAVAQIAADNRSIQADRAATAGTGAVAVSEVPASRSQVHGERPWPRLSTHANTLAEIIRSFTIPSKSTHRGLAWNRKDVLPIKWRHATPKSCAENKDIPLPVWDNFDLPFCRFGTARGLWQVTLMGLPDGVTAVQISPAGIGISVPFDGAAKDRPGILVPLEDIARSRAGVAAKLAFEEIKTCGSVEPRIGFFRVRSAAAKEAFLEIETWCPPPDANPKCTSFMLLALDHDYARRRMNAECDSDSN